MKKHLFTLISITSFFQLFAQNVGIGTSTPGTPLHIYNSSTDEFLRLQGNNPFLGFRTLAGNLKSYVQGFGDDLLVGTASGNPTGRIMFYNNNVTNMTILPNGNVGIGNTNPLSKLSFANGFGPKISFWNGGTNIDYGLGLQAGTLQFYTGGFDKMAFGYGSSNVFTETMTFFTGNGFLGLGTTTPQTKLHINQSNEALRLSGDDTYLSFYNGAVYKGFLQATGSDIVLGTPNSNTFGNLHLSMRGTPQLTVQSDGRVRVGALGCILQLEGALPPKFSIYGALGIKKSFADQIGEWAIGYGPYSVDGQMDRLFFYFNGGRKASVSTTDGSWNDISDFRLKENFETYKEVLEGIKKLNVLTYHYKSDSTGTRSFGLVAQNLQQHFPELVPGNEKDGYLSIPYGKTGVLAIKAIQEQQVIIEAQQKQIKTLEKRLAVLENKMR